MKVNWTALQEFVDDAAAEIKDAEDYRQFVKRANGMNEATAGLANEHLFLYSDRADSKDLIEASFEGHSGRPGEPSGKIVSAVIIIGNTRWKGPSHFQALMAYGAANPKAAGLPKVPEEKQGFETESGHFLDRTDAADYALGKGLLRNAAVKHDVEHVGKLTSEGLLLAAKEGKLYTQDEVQEVSASFEGHLGRPGERGGSLPKGEGESAAKPSSIKEAFSNEELKLPEFGAVKTPFKTKEEVYTEAKMAIGEFNKAMDTGKGIDAELGARSITVGNGKELIDALRETGPVVIMAPLKGEKRAAEKVEGKFGGDWSKLQDVVRGTVAVNSAQDIPSAIDPIRRKMAEHGWTMAAAPVDRMTSPLENGYRDMQLKFKNAMGMIAELQLNTKSMILEKESGEGHKLYERIRSIKESAMRDNRAHTTGESTELAFLDNRSREVYGRAWAGR